IDGCYDRAKQILRENRTKMDDLVRVLLEKESIEREDFLALMEGATVSDAGAPPIVSALPPPAAGNAPAAPSSEKPRRLPNLRPEPA
ncbi:MAG: cell division protein FtsH, partial [Armatimonadota bacterium]|nr:cell division protein FtsH [Armatimonadota bacterium]